MKKEVNIGRGILFALLLLALLFLASAQEEVIRSPRPTFTLQFDENVAVQRAEVEHLDSGKIIPVSATQINATVVSLRPDKALSNGEHMLRADIVDQVGNVYAHERIFTIQVPQTSITMVEPRLGVADRHPFSVTVKTVIGGQPEASQCQYTGSTDQSGNCNVVYDQPGNKIFDRSSSDGSEHTLETFFLIPDFPFPSPLCVVCKDSLQREVTQKFELYADTRTPEIQTVFVDPGTITDRSQGGLFTTELAVVAKDEDEVICKYGIDVSDYAQMIPFGNYDQLDYDVYATEHNQTVDDFDPEEEVAEYTLYVACEDRAGHVSPAEMRLVNVDLSAGLIIEVVEPREYVSQTTVQLQLKTNRAANCYWGETDEDIRDMSPTAPTAGAGKTHTAFLGTFGEGTHQLKAICRTPAFPELTEKAISFTVDTTPPSRPTISGSTVTCRDTGFYLSPPLQFSATDSTEISHYLYTLQAPEGSFLITSTQSGSSPGDLTRDSNGNSLLLQAQSSYTLRVKAVDRGGKESQEATTILTYNPSAVQCLERNPPTVRLIKEELANAVEVTLECEDDTGCDNSSYYFNTAESNEACSPTQRMYPPYTETLYTTAYFCYNVSDVNENSVEDGELIVVDVEPVDHCLNGELDEDETDVDCGGSECQPCSNNKDCSTDSDCLSGFCDETTSTCLFPSCEDSKKNQDETDVDCGGSCSQCEVGGSCVFPADCVSNFCDNGLCKEASCDDGVRNGQETDIDCGGTICTACADNKRCEQDGDCVSGLCEFGFCTGEGGRFPTGIQDTDGDGMPDDWEVRYGLNPDDPSDRDLDLDEDGLSNYLEYSNGTDPTNPDSDGDGFLDGEEIEAGTDPLNSEEQPASAFADVFASFFKNILFWLGIILLIGGLYYLAYYRYYEKPREAEQKKRATLETRMPGYGTRPELGKYRTALQQRQLAERQQRLDAMRERMEREKAAKQKERERVFSAFETGPASKTGAKESGPLKPTPAAKPSLATKPAQAPARKGYIALGEVGKTMREEGIFAALEKLGGGKPAKAGKEDVLGELRQLAKKPSPGTRRPTMRTQKRTGTAPRKKSTRRSSQRTRAKPKRGRK